MNENKEVKLSQTSSGIQSIIPLWIVFNQYVESKKKQILVIEEPELNLFPSTQHFLIDWIMRKMRKSAAVALTAAMAVTSMGVIPAMADETTTIRVMVGTVEMLRRV